MVHVIATIEVVTGKRAAFLTEFHRNVPLVRAESGCLEYSPTIDMSTGLAMQVGPREDTVVIVEKWESLDALRAHMAAPHMQTYRATVKDLVSRVHLQILQPA